MNRPKPPQYDEAKAHMSSEAILNLYRLDTEICRGHVVHRITTDPRKGIGRPDLVEEWSRVKGIGRGGFGEVFLEEERQGRVRAVKEIHKYFRRSQGHNHLRELLAMIWSDDQNYFPELYGWFEDEKKLYIAMQYFPLGDLTKIASTPLPEADSKSIIFQVAEALRILQDKAITHRDVKPQGPPYWWVKLGDFGISKRLQGVDTTLHTVFANGCYTAPEVYGENNDKPFYTSAVDIWSLGCVLYWLRTRETPSTIWKLAMGGKAAPRAEVEFTGLGSAGLDLLQQCFAVRPQERPKPSEVARSEWIFAAEPVLLAQINQPNDSLGRMSGAKRPGLSLASPAPSASTALIMSLLDLEKISSVKHSKPHLASSPMSSTLFQAFLQLKQDKPQELACLLPSGGWHTLFDDPQPSSRHLAEVRIDQLIRLDYDFPYHDAQNGNNAVHFAAKHGQLNLIDHLQAKGFNIRTKDRHGASAIHWAAVGGHAETIRHLLVKGLSINLWDNFGRTAMHFAASSRHINMVNYLDSLGVNVNAKSIHDWTVMHFAAQNGQRGMIDHLFSLGLDIEAKDFNGNEPEDVAFIHCHFLAAQRLRDLKKIKRPLALS